MTQKDPIWGDNFAHSLDSESTEKAKHSVGRQPPSAPKLCLGFLSLKETMASGSTAEPLAVASRPPRTTCVREQVRIGLRTRWRPLDLYPLPPTAGAPLPVVPFALASALSGPLQSGEHGSRGFPVRRAIAVGRGSAKQ
jgi:hypothetical protein